MAILTDILFSEFIFIFITYANNDDDDDDVDGRPKRQHDTEKKARSDWIES